MKILVFEQRYTRPDEAGIGRFNVFAREWARQGHKVDVVAGMINYLSGRKPEEYKRKLFVREEEGEGVRVFRVFDSVLGYRTFLGRLLSYLTFLESALIAGLLLRRPDVIIASSPPIFIGVLGYLTSIFKRAPFIFEVRDLWPDEAVELGFLKSKTLIKMSLRLEKFLYSRAKAIVVNSPGLKKYLIDRKAVPESKITNIPNPVSSDFLRNASGDELRRKFGWTEKFVALYSGSMAAVYDFDLILETAKEITHLPIIFVFVGDGRQKPLLMEKAKKQGLKNIQFLSPVGKKEIGNFIKAADIGVASLKKEIRLLNYVYASKIFDYLACARPMVVALSGVSADLLCREARAGLCVPPGDRAGFKKAILSLYKNIALRQKLGESGFAYIKKNFKLEKLAEEYFSVLTNQNQ